MLISLIIIGVILLGTMLERFELSQVPPANCRARARRLSLCQSRAD